MGFDKRGGKECENKLLYVNAITGGIHKAPKQYTNATMCKQGTKAKTRGRKKVRIVM